MQATCTLANSQSKPIKLNKMNPIQTQLINYREKFDNELHNNILSFWMKYGVEKDGHGFYGAIDLDRNPVLSANKTSVLNARILWTFASAAIQFNEPRYAEIAEKAYRVVTEDFADQVYGGYYMELTSSDAVANDIKHTYAQAFVLYSLCKYYEFNPSGKVLQKIKDFFALLEEKAKDPQHPGYLESFTRDWNIYEENPAPTEIICDPPA